MCSHFQNGTKELVASVGSSLTFICYVPGPEATGTWYLNSEAIVINDQVVADGYAITVEARANSMRYILQIASVNADSEGEYDCRSGSDNDAVYVVVTSKYIIRLELSFLIQISQIKDAEF